MTSDITAPTLDSLVLSDTSINIDNGEMSFVVTAHFTDDLSGVFDGTFANGSGGAPPQIHFESSTGQIASGVFDILHPVSGNTLDGVFQATVTLTSFAEAGTWHVRSMILSDEAGNNRQLDPNGSLLGSKTFSVVNANSDTVAPQLQSMSFVDSTIDIDAGQTTVTATAHLTDNVSGLFNFGPDGNGTVPQISFVSPSGQIIGGSFDIAHPVSGTSTDGFFNVTATFGPFAEAGAWHVYSVVLNDKAHNSILLDSAHVPLLAGLTFTVSNSHSDAIAPKLKSINISQPALQSNGDFVISVDVRLTDAVSGIADGAGADAGVPHIFFESSHGQLVAGTFDILHPVSGNLLDGVFARLRLSRPVRGSRNVARARAQPL